MEDWKKILKMHEIPPRYINCDFEKHPALKDRWSEIKEYGTKPKGNIIMSGSCGNGKTLTAVAIMAIEAEKYGIGARFFNSETLYNSWYSETRNGSPNDFSRKLGDTRLLILDDFGQGEISDSFKRWIYSIINKRWEWERPTILTTNLDDVVFRKIFGDAILSRLLDGKIWKFKDRDYRINK